MGDGIKAIFEGSWGKQKASLFDETYVFEAP
jgi:hypothetical protein